MKHPSYCCQKCGERMGWLRRWIFPFMHRCESRTEVHNLWIPTPKWKWDVFGDGSLTVKSGTLKPTAYRRFISSLVLGSKWERINQDKQP